MLGMRTGADWENVPMPLLPSADLAAGRAEIVMSRRLWRCRNRACPVQHGAVLGRLTEDGGLLLESTVTQIRCYFDIPRGVITCPACSVKRTFIGKAIETLHHEKDDLR